MSDDRPRPPKGLIRSARRLWLDLVDRYDFRPDELRLLEAYCRFDDELEVLEAALAGADVWTVGSKDQERVNPLFHEVRQHRLAMARLAAQLGLSDAAADDAGLARSTAGRKMAHLRWNRGA